MVGISSDWLFPPGEIKALAERMIASGVDAKYAELQSTHGHDGFLAEPDAFAPIVRKFLSNAG
jgi:homoserine O-acetyltransferase